LMIDIKIRSGLNGLCGAATHGGEAALMPPLCPAKKPARVPACR